MCTGVHIYTSHCAVPYMYIADVHVSSVYTCMCTGVHVYTSHCAIPYIVDVHVPSVYVCTGLVYM